MIERLLKAISELDYPKDKFEIQVLDDSTDETRELTERSVAKLRERGFDAVVLHRENRVGFKAGALDNGFNHAKGDFFFILDADFVPPRNILKDCIHHFADPRVGMIQTRWGHINRSYSWLTRAQAILLDGHLVLEQTARSRTGRFFNFNGTAGLWRKRCIGEAGGWQHDTLTEDLDLSYRAQLRGWKFVFLADIVTPAELPVDIDGFKSQQHRWTKGSIQTCKKVSAADLAEQIAFVHQDRSDGASDREFCLPVAGLSLRVVASICRPGPARFATGGCRSHVADRFADLCGQPRRRPRFSIFVRKENSIRKIGNGRSGFSHLSWRSELAFRSIMHEAVLEAIFNRQSDFCRTPKYGIERAKQQWKSSRYSAVRTVIPLVEFIFAVYFTYFVFHAFQNREFLSLPFLMLFQTGFAYVAFCSVWQRFMRPQWNPRDISVA